MPDVVAPPPRHPRFPLIDGVRAIAVLCVVTLHVAVYIGTGDSLGDRLLAHLNLGVTIFFLISGFLLYRPFIAWRTGGPSAPRIGDYFKRRALRIFPAYWLIVTVAVLAPGLTATSDGHWFQQYALLFSLSSSGGWTCSDCVLAQTWSLVVEMTFYVALPLYVLAANRLAKGRSQRTWVRLELGLLALLALGSIVLDYFIYDGRPPALVGGSLLSSGLWFALGMALAVASVATIGTVGRSMRLMPRGSSGVLWLAALGVYVALVLVLPPSPFILGRGDQLLGFAGLALIALLLLAPAITTDRQAGVPGEVLASRPVAWIGLVSYGVFLWHFFVLKVLIDSIDNWSFVPLLFLVIAISLAIAAASYYALERPILRLKATSTRGRRLDRASRQQKTF